MGLVVVVFSHRSQNYTRRRVARVSQPVHLGGHAELPEVGLPLLSAVRDPAVTLRLQQEGRMVRVVKRTAPIRRVETSAEPLP